MEPSIETITGLTPSATTLLWPFPAPDIGCTNKYPFGFGPGRNTVGGLYTRVIDQAQATVYRPGLKIIQASIDQVGRQWNAHSK